MIKKLTLILATISMGTALLTVPVFAAEDTAAESSGTTSAAQNAVCDGVGLASGGNGCVEDPNGPNVNSIIKTVISTLSFIVGFVAVIMLIIGGLKYITSSGDANSISSAKNTILYAIIGLVIVVLAQVIVRFVLNTV